jgi:hypothetical protein
LIGGVNIAIGGTKTRAHNSKKNNYNPKKIERHLNIKEKLEGLATQYENAYTCPQGKKLKTSGTWHLENQRPNQLSIQKTPHIGLQILPDNHLCTGRKKGGREIERRQYADYVGINKDHYPNNPDVYRRW